MGLFDVFCKATKVRGLQNSNAYLTVTQRLEFSLLFTDQSLPPPPPPPGSFRSRGRKNSSNERTCFVEWIETAVDVLKK